VSSAYKEINDSIMKTMFKIILVFLFCFSLASCFFQPSMSDKVISYNIDSLATNFIVVKQDTTHFYNGEIYTYSIVKDSMARVFYLLEDGCNYKQETSSIDLSIGDTVHLFIHLADPLEYFPEPKDEFKRGPCGELRSIIVVIDQEYCLEVYQTKQLCNHKYIK